VSITAVKIEGFQSHVNSYFPLGAGLNVITGPSDAGKTAVIRAVKWIAFNEPQGEAFVNVSVGEAAVTIFLENGAIITKRRRKGKTSYLIQQNEEDEGSLYEKSEVPDEVKRLLQIEKQTFGDFETALNFSFQLDAPFLISETASAGAKILGKLAGTESVDLAIKGVRQDTHYTRLDRTAAEKEIEQIAGRMLAYTRIDDAKEAVDLAEMLLEQIENNHTKYENLKQYRNTYEIALEKTRLVALQLDKLAHIPALEEDLKDIEKAQQRYDDLSTLYSQYSQVQTRIEMLGTHLEKFNEVETAADFVEVITNIADKLSLLNILRQEYQKYTEILRKIFLTLEKTEFLEAANDLLHSCSEGMYQVNDLKMLKVEFDNATRRVEMAQNHFERFGDLSIGESILRESGAEIERLAALKLLKAEFRATNDTLYRYKRDLDLAENDLQAANKEEAETWESAGGICPLCEQPHERGAC
jgi:exonuclease SbcC